MDSIKKAGHNIWLVNGKVIGSAGDGVFDDAAPEGQVDLVEISNTARTGPLFPHGGDPLYAVIVKRDRGDPRSKFFVTNCPHLRELPEDVKAVLRKEMPGYASEF